VVAMATTWQRARRT